MCQTATVYPSAADFDTLAMPSVPPAPPTFSTSTFCPRVRPIDSAMRRATVSVGPPDAAGTISVIGLFGKAVCAVTACDANAERAARALVRIARRLNRIGHSHQDS